MINATTEEFFNFQVNLISWSCIPTILSENLSSRYYEENLCLAVCLLREQE